MKIIVFIFLISFTNQNILKKRQLLLKLSQIPEEFREFITDENGICIYFIKPTGINKLEIQSKVKEEDLFDTEKLIAAMQGETVFDQQWESFTKVVNQILEDHNTQENCVRKILVTYESFFTYVLDSSQDDQKTFLPVSLNYFEEKLTAMKQIINDNKAMLIVNQLIMAETDDYEFLENSQKKFQDQAEVKGAEFYNGINTHHESILADVKPDANAQDQKKAKRKVSILNDSSFFIYNGQLILSQTKSIPYNELINLANAAPPNCYKNVFYYKDNIIQKESQEDYDKVFFSQICWEHYASCTLPDEQIFWIVLSNTIQANVEKIYKSFEKNVGNKHRLVILGDEHESSCFWNKDAIKRTKYENTDIEGQDQNQYTFSRAIVPRAELDQLILAEE